LPLRRLVGNIYSIYDGSMVFDALALLFRALIEKQVTLSYDSDEKLPLFPELQNPVTPPAEPEFT